MKALLVNVGCVADQNDVGNKSSLGETMHKAALQLFLTESTALQLAEVAETAGGLPSALSKRHKIRKTDLERIFALANQERASSLARKYLVMLLLTYGGAAY